MKITQLRKQISNIAEDQSKSVEDRINEILSLREEFSSHKEVSSGDKAEQLRFDVECYSKLLDVVIKANRDNKYDIELFQLYTLLVESYDRLREFRPMKHLAEGILALIKDCDVSYQVIEQSLPRIIDAFRNSVYNHDRYRLLAAFLHAAHAAASDDDYYSEELVKEKMREMLNLRGLLDPATRPDLLDADLMMFISYHIPPDEFNGIIDNPKEHYLKKDPVEYSLRWEEVYYDVIDELDRRFADTPKHMGFCFTYWPAMANLLRKKYGIEWRNPSLMNPRVMFD